MIEAVDLFCGSGGLTCGLRQSGVNVLAGVDFEKECQYPYERNNGSKFLNWDIGKTEAGDIAALYSKDVVRVLAGCAPCQPFSRYNNGVDTSLSEKWWLLYSFQRIIEGVMPEIVVMENVTDVVRHKVYHDFVSHLRTNGYYVSENNVSCVDYGIPQKRKRQIVLCSRFGPIELLSKTHETAATVREAAIFQTYPEYYVFFDENNPLSFASVGGMIGNSVPVRLGEVIGQSIQQHVKAMV